MKSKILFADSIVAFGLTMRHRAKLRPHSKVRPR